MGSKREAGPSEIRIRHARLADCAALARVLIEATESAFRGRVPDRCLDWLTPEESAANWAKNFATADTLSDGRFLFVAESASGEVVGLALLGETAAREGQAADLIAPFPYELRVLNVAPAWQRRGVGRRLVARVAAAVSRQGGARLLVAVLVDNPNVAFYERLGAVRLGSRPYDWEGYATEELLYGWQDVGRLRIAPSA